MLSIAQAVIRPCIAQFSHNAKNAYFWVTDLRCAHLFVYSIMITIENRAYAENVQC